MFKFETDSKIFRLQELYDMLKQGTLSMNIMIQRGDLWSIKQRSLFVHSALLGILDVQPPFIFSRRLVYRDDGTSSSMYCVLDGKQRLTSLFNFIDGLYALSHLEGEESVSCSTYTESFTDGEYPIYKRYDEDSHICTSTITGEGLEGLKFQDLGEFCSILLNSTVHCTVLMDPTPEQEALVFSRLNNGKPMSKLDQARAVCKATSEIRNVAELHEEFFNIMFKKAQLSKKPEDEIVVKTKIMLDAAESGTIDNVNLSSKSYSEYIQNMEASVDLSKVSDVFSRAVDIYNSIPEDENFNKSTFIANKSVFLALVPFLAMDYSDEELIYVIKEITLNKLDAFKTGSSHSPNAAAISSRHQVVADILKH